MAINIYKPGQGYWTRMLSAIGGGILVVAGALWLKQKLEVFQGDYSVFIQWGAALLVIAIFAPLIYRWVGTKPRTCDFMVATDGEMKKVAWPSRKEVTGSTLVVIWCVVLLSALLFLADIIFSTFFTWINVLDVG
jgi:preprotein translocase SecE subunit